MNCLRFDILDLLNKIRKIVKHLSGSFKIGEMSAKGTELGIIRKCKPSNNLTRGSSD